MGFFGYLLLGAIAYGSGWLIRRYILEKKVLSEKALAKEGQEIQSYGLKSPLVIKYLAGFFVIMLIVSALISRFVLGKTEFDIAYIIVNSVVATFVFSFGLIKDEVKHELPD